MLKLKLVALIASISTICLSVSAIAADKVAPSTDRYSGLYAGVQVSGYGISDHWSGSVLDHGNNNVSGLSGGLRFGYGVTLSQSIYFGIELDASLSEKSYSARLPVESGYDARLNYDAAARLRLGYMMGGLMLYGTAGPALASIDRTFVHPTLGTQDFKDRALGWTAGGGAEYALNDSLSMLVEYRRTQTSTTNGSFWLPSVEHNDVTLNSVVVGINYTFH